MIKIIEEKPLRTEDGDCIHPIMMLKEGKEIFITNRNTIFNSDIDRRIDVAKRSDGKFTIIYGIYDNPFDMLQDNVEKKQYIREDMKEIFDNSEAEDDFMDFTGCTFPAYSIFNYRIFDDRLLQDIKEIVELINNQEWDKAMLEINQKRRDHKEFVNMKDELLGLEFNQFYSLIHEQLESVKQSRKYLSFKEDIFQLIKLHIGTEPSSIMANNLLKEICKLDKIQLKKYVDNYTKGDFDTYSKNCNNVTSEWQEEEYE